MNHDIIQLAKSGNAKSKLQKLLLIDHSEVYFENGRLDEELTENKKTIENDQARQLSLIDAEILELWEYLEQLDVLKQTSEETRKERPHSTGRIKKHKTRKAPGTAPPGLRTQPKIGAQFRNDAVSDEESDTSRGPSRQFQQSRYQGGASNSRPVSRAENIFQSRGASVYHQQPPQVDSRSPSRISKKERKPKLSKEKRLQKQLEEITLKIKDLGKLPKDWYTTALPASDAVLARTRRQEEDPTYDPELKIWAQFILKIKQKRPDLFKKMKKVKDKESGPVTEEKHDSDDDEQEVGLKVVCDKKVKPVVMSLRKLKELAHIDSLSDRVKNKKAEKQRKMIEALKKYSDDLKTDVEAFVADVKLKVEQDLKDCEAKEPEEEEDEYDAFPGLP